VITVQRLFLYPVIFVLSANIIGCADMTKQQAGTGIGAVVGGALGNAIGGKNKELATVIGVAAGAVVGNKIGQYLDEKDQKLASAAATKALDTNKPQSWTNPETGNSGKIVVAKATNNKPQQANPQGTQAAPKTCKTITQTVTLKDGTTRNEDVTACKGANGWEIT
jgi:surface antigen